MFLRFFSIETFDKFATRAEWRRDHAMGDRGIVRLRPKIKLHGANVGYVIRREPDLAISAVFGRRESELNPAVSGADACLSRLENKFFERNPQIGKTFFFGEWAGSGVAKKDAVTRIGHPCFFPFMAAYVRPENIPTLRALRNGDAEAEREFRRKTAIITDPDVLREMVPVDPRIRVIPWAAETALFDFSDESSLDAAIAEVNAKVTEIGIVDPYISAEFGVRGPGEGLVFLPESSSFESGVSMLDAQQLSFKAKTAAHAVRATKAPAERRAAIPEGVDELVADFVTPARCEQILAEVMHEGPCRERTRDFIVALRRDVLKESGPEREGLGPDAERPLIAAIDKAAAKWFTELFEDATPTL